MSETVHLTLDDQRALKAALRSSVRILDDTRDMTTGEAEAYRRGFADARERAASVCDCATYAADDDTPTDNLIRAAARAIRTSIRAMEPKE